MTSRIIPAILAVLLAILAPCTAAATDAGESAKPAVSAWQADPTAVFDARDIDLDRFKWVARPLIVFSDAPQDPAFRTQMELLAARIDELVKRDVVLIADSAPADGTDIRREFRPRGFMLIVMSKDGRVILRKPFPRDVREITRSIDNLPIRKQELRDALDGG